MADNMELFRAINERLEAIGTKVDEGALRKLIAEQFEALMGDREFARKMRFGGNGDKLAGSKYARWGLNAADVEFMYDLLNAAQRCGMSRGPSDGLTRAFEDVSQARYMPADDKFDGVNWRAMDTAESGYGSQLVGAQYVGELWEGARAESRVFGLIPTFEMSAPTAYLPVAAAFPEMLFVAENTANNSSNYGTSKTGSQSVTVSAKKFVIHQMWSGEMEEDSIIPFVPFLRQQAQRALAFYSDSLVINGDDTNAGTGNINLDDADPTDTKHYLAFDGIRHAALVDNTNNAVSSAGAALSFDVLIALRGKMLDSTYKFDWGHPNDPSDLVYVADTATCDQIALLDEVITVDKFGSQATVMTGQQARIGQHPLISSMAVGLTEADGNVATTNVYGQVVAFNRGGFNVGWRRRVKLETERIPATDQSRIVYSLRMGFGRYSPTGAASGIEAAAVQYYIGL